MSTFLKFSLLPDIFAYMEISVKFAKKDTTKYFFETVRKLNILCCFLSDLKKSAFDIRFWCIVLGQLPFVFSYTGTIYDLLEFKK